MIDLPGGGGKIPLVPEYVLGEEKGRLRLKNYLGEEYIYPLDAEPHSGKKDLFVVG
jgi:lysine 2,3-aminomutase